MRLPRGCSVLGVSIFTIYEAAQFLIPELWSFDSRPYIIRVMFVQVLLVVHLRLRITIGA